MRLTNHLSVDRRRPTHGVPPVRGMPAGTVGSRRRGGDPTVPEHAATSLAHPPVQTAAASPLRRLAPRTTQERTPDAVAAVFTGSSMANRAAGPFRRCRRDPAGPTSPGESRGGAARATSDLETVRAASDLETVRSNSDLETIRSNSDLETARATSDLEPVRASTARRRGRGTENRETDAGCGGGHQLTFRHRSTFLPFRLESTGLRPGAVLWARAGPYGDRQPNRRAPSTIRSALK